MQLQTVFRSGNSDVVAIPRDIGKYFGIKTGGKVIVDKSSDGEGILIKKVSQKPKIVNSEVSTEFKKWLDRAVKEDEAILDELSLR